MLRFHIAPVPFVVACALSAYVDNSCAQGDLLPEPDIAKLVRVLEADSPTYAKAMACRRLALIGDRDAVPALAKLLSNSQLDALSTASTDRQVLLILAVADIGDPAAASAIAELATSDSTRVRIEALRALARFRDPAAVPILLKAVTSADKVVAPAAGSTLADIESPEVDRAIVGMLRSGQPRTRLVATALVGKRHIAAATPVLFEFAKGSDPAQRQEAIVALGATAELNDLPQLIEMVATIRQSGDEALLSDALKAACSRLPREAAAEISGLAVRRRNLDLKTCS